METIKYGNKVYQVDNINATDRDTNGVQIITITGYSKNESLTSFLQVVAFAYSTGLEKVKYSQITLPNSMLNKFSGGDDYVRQSDFKTTAI
ncbi:hypothetical protein HXA31_20330 [Salipaludibacillus agaradhaerens]|jgi:hypothetical protein|uniref:Uncharacterized protein n=1 Tax=Salipaludibacillus agaradhaerens TaxID=76935 RepID=A0A9Q4B239_SALAG|nr:hypothetical protein [Salipaludibacillus agaradhaerens]MCR6096909.1 hypothetical protein [Salipaludibacillus agaradhaerens]MCR6116679.1 hypothetical protein [Salipaludibacillus agaradhaerens]